MNEDDIRKVVRDKYGKIAKQGTSCCGSVSSCCGSESTAERISGSIGYTGEEIHEVPDGANLGLGCGNPLALASLKDGETVLDLGSGAGFDSFLASPRVGAGGRVIGVDMTPEMIEKARENAGNGNYENVEFRLGEIENLPVADDQVDIVISNCVINLAPDKKGVFEETYRVLKPGGRIMISDITLLAELPDSIKNSMEAYIGCISGAMRKEEYLKTIAQAGFQDVKVMEETYFPVDLMTSDPVVKGVFEELNIPDEEMDNIARSVVSINVRGVKPLQG